MRSRACALAFALLMLQGAAAQAYVPEKTPHRAVAAAGTRVIEQPAARGSLAGIVAMRGGRVLFSRNADVPMIPASLMKLATTTTAMLRLGPRHRFATRALGVAAGGRVETLYLVGGGDPTFATRAYRRVRFLPKQSDPIQRPAFASGSPTVEDLARAIARAGITNVGRIVADDILFDAVRTQRGWLSRYLFPDPDTGYLSALSLNEGIADLQRTHVVPDQALASGLALRSALRARGVRVPGDVATGRTPDATPELARVTSPPLHEIIDFVNRYSINFPSEMILKGLGAALRGEGSTAAGVAVVRATLTKLGVPLRGFRQYDGSGLSVLDRMTPRTVAAILDLVANRPGARWAALRSTIAVAGRPGVLLNRMTGAPTGGNLRGKTGFLEGVRAMAGWVTALDGVPVTYVALFNRARSALALTGPLDLFGLLLAVLPFA